MKYTLFVILLAITFAAPGQSKTTQSLEKKYKGTSYFFYNNTLRMINQGEDPGFDDVIRDIEKMKILMIKKSAGDFNYKKVVEGYKGESFEEMMTSRVDGKNFDVYVQEKNNKTTGMLVLVNDASNLFVLDIVGRIALDKVMSLYKTLDSSSDMGKRFRDFAEGINDNKD
jgi:hypothetical protein